ncbi:Zn-ribbon domain-containing OB-fold protein [Actinomadura madurae]|uniref:Zn-ribbon domain-containing OB-fold protein n=1 Tax=Actinomadura madurae TaxID=1993 RepID=UPI002026341B|nr:Zn-ribbon domain-containing OB-fold protein [Actinomadura madurae]MCP9951960.1 Zn-ribbon domain-containing OB-fold protein [Actinomadura madurae]MCP9968724.1 Zn-ribbon domain-containing OB-fold protein [Actinomadura madurae]MCP9981205.1 Zn-ribbon domain-containing OB-fold protein [Actinomadura madurae]MCQ0007301.1 Zn-ribbon domain-containing OB-fold protein [Actinomadura madurae]MCQ0017395.1 Zn-ribbon domain-containing OB-fold protein [Actinomadura madurae]
MTDSAEILDPPTTTFWSAAAEGRLLVQRCTVCGHHQLYPRPFCMVCDLTDLTWTEASGLGTVYSCVTVHLPVRDDIPPPYTVGLVEIDEGPRLLARMPDTAAIGDRVAARWRRPDAGTRPVLFFDEVGEVAL